MVYLNSSHLNCLEMFIAVSQHRHQMENIKLRRPVCKLNNARIFIQSFLLQGFGTQKILTSKTTDINNFSNLYLIKSLDVVSICYSSFLENTPKLTSGLIQNHKSTKNIQTNLYIISTLQYILKESNTYQTKNIKKLFKNKQKTHLNGGLLAFATSDKTQLLEQLKLQNPIIYIQMSQHSQILGFIKDYQQQNVTQLTRLLEQLKTTSDTQKSNLNQALVKSLKDALQNIIKSSKEQQYTLKLKSLLQVLFHGLQVGVVWLSVILGLIDDIFDCLPLSCLQSLFQIVQIEMSKIENVSLADQNILLRITNGMLRRIPKSDNIEFRGRLHLLLSKILRLCHDSGMVRAQIADVQVGELDKNKDTQNKQDFDTGNKNNISHKFYIRFWGLQKYFANPGATLFSEDKDPQVLQYQELEKQQQSDVNPKRKLLVFKLKTVLGVINEVLRIFNNNPIPQSDHLQYHQPVKHLTGQNLLQTQLSDPHFRKLFSIQAFLFCFNLLNPNTKTPFYLLDDEKKIIADTQKLLKQHVGDTSKIEGFLDSERNWIDLKQNWKNRKITLQRNPDSKIQEELKYLQKSKNLQSNSIPKDFYGNIISPSSQPIQQKIQKLYSLTMEKMNLQGTKMSAYIQTQKQVSENPLSIKPLLPSFYYYYNQSLRALEGLNQGGFEQIFQNRAVYSMWEWKSLKALARQSIKDLQSDRKDNSNGKHKDYKILSIVKKREDNFGEIASKKLKIDKPVEQNSAEENIVSNPDS